MKLFTSVIFLLASMCSLQPQAEIIVNQGMLIENITIITDSENGVISYKGYVAVSDGKIVYAAQVKPKLKGKYKTIDGKGKFIIPGLIDSHVHLANVAGLNFQMGKKYPQLRELYYNQLPKSYLYFGYTTLIDLNNYAPKIIDKLMAMPVIPDIYTCGRQVEVKNGFMMAETNPEDIEEEFPNYLHDHYQDDDELTSGIGGHTVKDVVNNLKNQQQSICVKTLYEDGFGGTEEVTWKMPSIQILSDVVTEAKALNMPVVMHANSYNAQKFALESGVDIIAHGMWHWGELTEFMEINELPITHKELLKTIAASKTAYQPTFRVIAGQRDLFDKTWLYHPDLKNVMPSALITFLKSDDGSWQAENIRGFAKKLLGKKTDEELFYFFQNMIDKIAASALTISEENGKLLFGTDSPAMNAYTNVPGLNGFLEMQEWINAGISLEKLFKACTSENAEAFNLKDIGTIEKNKKANLLILDKNPLETVDAYNSIHKVILKGEVYDRYIFKAG